MKNVPLVIIRLQRNTAGILNFEIAKNFFTARFVMSYRYKTQILFQSSIQEQQNSAQNSTLQKETTSNIHRQLSKWRPLKAENSLAR